MLRKSVIFRQTSIVGLLMLFLFLAEPFLQGQKAASRLPEVIDESKLIPLSGSVHPLARPQYDHGAVAGNLPMERMLLVLKRSDAQEKALQSAIRAMHDPKSPQYHRWLTPAEFGATYGASDQDVQKISSWLESHGFRVTHVANGRGTIEFSGTADQVSTVFHTSIHTYLTNGKQHFANATAPQIPSGLAPVVAGVLSLHNFEKKSSVKILSRANIERDPSNGSVKLTYDPKFTSGTGAHAVSPGDLWTIYDATPLITASTRIDGTGQTIAIVGRSDISLDDYQGFRANLLPAPYSGTVPFTQIQNGPDPGIVSGDDVEQTLDVEYSSAMAPGAQIKLVVSGSTNTTDGVDLSAQYVVDNNLAPVVSTSYGLCEALMGAGNQFYSALWEQAAAQGITAMVSSGDNGSAGCDLVGPSGDEGTAFVADEGLQVSGLASTPYNIAVGGNEFSDDTTTYWSNSNSSSPAPLTSALSFVPEKVWNESCSPTDCGNANANIAAGSGGTSGCFNPTFRSDGNIASCSGGYDTPEWQAGVVGIPSDGKRHLPDVSLTAASHDGYMICYNRSCDNGGVYIIGGTSASSPAFTGIMALVNQSTGSRQGQANYTLYRLAGAEYGTSSSPNTSNLSSCNASNGNSIGTQCIFHDVTAGTNAVPCDGGMLNCSSTTQGTYGVLTGYAAAAGFDRATGLGSVDVANLVNHWNDVTTAPTTTTLSLGATHSTFGQAVSLSVNVQPTSGSGTPTGQVALLTDSTSPSAISAGSITLSNGSYSGTISSLPGGTYHVSARYAGDGSFSSSTSSAVSMTVDPADSSVQLSFQAVDPVTGTSIAGAAAPYGSKIVATATLNGVSGQQAPTGIVTFTSAGTTVATVQSDPTGLASYTSSGYALGTYSWTAAYAGNSNYHNSTSSSASFTVGQAATLLKLQSSTSFVVGSNSATLTAFVGDDSFLSNPTGTVSFAVNGTQVGTAQVQPYQDPASGASAGKAVFSLPASALTAGLNTVTSSYSGDGNYQSSSSSSISIGYSATAPSNAITLSVTPVSATPGQIVTIAATVTTGGLPATAGTVNFFDGSSLLGSVQVVGNTPAQGFTTGTASLKTILGIGSHAVSAVYSGILAAPTAVSSSSVSVSVAGKASSAVALSATPNTQNPNNYDLAAVVSGYGFTTPSAAIDFVQTSAMNDFGQTVPDSVTASHTFLAPIQFTEGDSTGATPSQSVVADFNGDGIPDLATANASFTGGTVSVLLGNGDGTYKAPVTYATNVFACAIAAADFNNDGVPDIAVTTQYDSTGNNPGGIGILLGKGDGTFQPQIFAPISGYAEGTVVGDFNRDGVLDIASVQFYPTQFSVAYGIGDGTFQAPVSYAIPAQMFSPFAMAGGDLNGDGVTDLVEVNVSDGTACIFMNSGSGTFTQGNCLTTGTGPEWVTVADVNNDGKQDVLVSNYSDNTIGVFLGKGDGSFQSQVTYPVNGYASTLAVADLNGDGNPDIAAGYFYPTAAVGVLLGKGDGTFSTPQDFKTNQGHGYGVTLADLNGDGTPDIVSSNIRSGDGANQELAVLLNVTQATAAKANVAVAGSKSSTQQVQATYMGDSAYVASVSKGVLLSGSGVKATPQIIWIPASLWGVGVPLGSSVLDATVSGGIAGSLAYTAQLGSGSPVAVSADSTLSSPGNYLVTATFTPTDSSTYSVASAQQTIQITNPDFALTGSGSQSQNVSAGGAVTFTVSVPSLYGFGGQITLGCAAPLPGGFTCSASPSTLMPGESSTITIKTQGLPSQSAAVVSHRSWAEWTVSGIALSCVFLLPVARRRRDTWVAVLVLVSLFGTLVGCGGGSFSQTSIAVATSSPTAASGKSVQLTATITSKHAAEGGTVTFYNGNTVIGAPVSVQGISATLQTSALPVGLNQITAVYSGDKNNSGSTSNAISQLITGQTIVRVIGTAGAVTHTTDLQVTLQ